MSTTFSVGARVRLPLGASKVVGSIVEDRGSIGVQGRRLFRVLIPVEPDEPIFSEVPEHELELLANLSAKDKELDLDDVINYLKVGGLTSILRANLSGGPNQPRAWLCLDQLGQMTHTFVEERGWLGGATVPFMAVEGRRIFQPKRDEVRAFLRSFGLDQQKADEVIAAVGTYPR